MAILPLSVRSDDETLERTLADASGAGGGVMAPCLVLAHAEELLEHAAKEEARLTGLFMHLTTFLLNAAYTAVLAVAFRDLETTVVGGAGAFVIGELEILSTPSGAVRALERYRLGDLGGGSRRAAVSWTLAPLGVAPGLAVMATF